MDVREKLVEIIQNSVGGCARHWAEIIADGLIANGVTVQEWVSVEDRLPDEGVFVLMYRESGFNIECVVIKSDGVWLGDVWGDAPVTHWMPLPQPPKGE